MRPARRCLGLWLMAINRWEATGLLKHRLDQAGTAYDAAFYVLAALLFLRSYRRADTPLLRQQLKWLTRGALLAVVPFTLFYAIPFLFDVHMPGVLTKLAGLSLVFLPLTFSWAIVRYRLMDTDLIFKRGVAYTLATGLMLGGYFGVIALIAGNGAQRPAARRSASGRLGIAILVAAAIFRPAQAPHSGLGGPGLRPPSLRLPQGAGRVWPRSEFRDRSERAARLDRGAAAAHPAGGAGRGLPDRRIGAGCAWPLRTGCPRRQQPRRTAPKQVRSISGSSTSTGRRTTRTSFLRTRSRPCTCLKYSAGPPRCST